MASGPNSWQNVLKGPLILIGLTSGFATFSIVLIELFRPGDNTTVITVIVGFTVPTITSLLTLLKTDHNTTLIAEHSQRINDFHDSMNDRIDRLLADAKRQGFEEGVATAKSRRDGEETTTTTES